MLGHQQRRPVGQGHQLEGLLPGFRPLPTCQLPIQQFRLHFKNIDGTHHSCIQWPLQWAPVTFRIESKLPSRAIATRINATSTKLDPPVPEGVMAREHRPAPLANFGPLKSFTCICHTPERGHRAHRQASENLPFPASSLPSAPNARRLPKHPGSSLSSLSLSPDSMPPSPRFPEHQGGSKLGNLSKCRSSSAELLSQADPALLCPEEDTICHVSQETAFRTWREVGGGSKRRPRALGDGMWFPCHTVGLRRRKEAQESHLLLQGIAQSSVRGQGSWISPRPHRASWIICGAQGKTKM